LFVKLTGSVRILIEPIKAQRPHEIGALRLALQAICGEFPETVAMELQRIKLGILANRLG
jgi:hypothetical protein